MTTATLRLEHASITPLHWIAIAMALVSAIVHLVVGIGFLPHWMGVLFVLSTGGFVGAVALVLVGYRRRLLYLLGIPFTGSQIVFWYAVNQPTALGAISVPALVDKVAQVVLLVALVVLLRRES